MAMSADPAPVSPRLLTLSQILSISVYYASGKADRDLVNEGQHRRVSIHHGRMNLADILQSEIANEKAGAGPEIAAELESGLSKAGKKGGRMLVTGMDPSRTAMSNTDRCRSLCF